MKKGFLLIVLLLVVGCKSGQTQTGPTAGDIKPPSIKGVLFAGGDGSSIENAVIIKATNELAGVRGEYDWIRKNHPDWKLEKQSVLKGGGKIYDKMDFQTPDGRPATLFFDITDFFGKL
ncbi:MAG: hypothetical protein ABII09_02275 [Planctomycetota bacterium]